MNLRSTKRWGQFIYVLAHRTFVHDIFDQRNSVISPTAVINAHTARFTHIFSTTLEIVVLMRDRDGLNGACFRENLLWCMYRMYQNTQQ